MSQDSDQQTFAFNLTLNEAQRVVTSYDDEIDQIQDQIDGLNQMPMALVAFGDFARMQKTIDDLTQRQDVLGMHRIVIEEQIAAVTPTTGPATYSLSDPDNKSPTPGQAAVIDVSRVPGGFGQKATLVGVPKDDQTPAQAALDAAKTAVETGDTDAKAKIQAAKDAILDSVAVAHPDLPIPVALKDAGMPTPAEIVSAAGITADDIKRAAATGLTVPPGTSAADLVTAVKAHLASLPADPAPAPAPVAPAPAAPVIDTSSVPQPAAPAPAPAPVA